MGCNCKTTEKILKIHKKYGQERYVSLGEKIKFRTIEFFKFFLVILIAFIFIPIIFIFVMINTLKGKTNININKIIRKIVREK